MIDPIADPAQHLHWLSDDGFASLSPEVVQSLRGGRLYELCLEIFRKQMASGQTSLDDNVVQHLSSEVLYQENLSFIAGVALSRPTFDYEELFCFAFGKASDQYTPGVREKKDIHACLISIIKAFDLQKHFYHYLIAQKSNDEVLIKAFGLDSVDAARLIAPHGDPVATKRILDVQSKGARSGMARLLASFDYAQSLGFREKLTGTASLGNHEFVKRLQNLFESLLGKSTSSNLPSPPHVDSLQQVLELPGFDEKISLNGPEVLSKYFSSVRYAMDSECVSDLTSVERVIVTPALMHAGNRIKAFYEHAMGKDTSWVMDAMDTPDGGKADYYRALVDGACSSDLRSQFLVRPFVLLEEPSSLLTFATTDEAISRLYSITTSPEYLVAGGSPVRDRAMAHDLGL